MPEINFQCSDCGLCFQDNEEGARLAKEHVKLTGHNEDLMSYDVVKLLAKARETISKIPSLTEVKHD